MDLPFRKMIDIPPVWLALFLSLALAQSVWLPLFPAGAITRVAGAALIAAGVALLVAASLQFRRHATTIIPHHDPAAIITGGVYALSRNPIYLADAMILAGLVLVWDAALAAPLVPAFMALITRRYIRGEEVAIATLFGPEYQAYRARVRRWL